MSGRLSDRHVPERDERLKLKRDILLWFTEHGTYQGNSKVMERFEKQGLDKMSLTALRDLSLLLLTSNTPEESEKPRKRCERGQQCAYHASGGPVTIKCGTDQYKGP